MSIVTREGADPARPPAQRTGRTAARRTALTVFIALAFAPLLPGLVAALALGLGMALGCGFEAIGGCRVAGIGLGRLVAATARIGWAVPFLALPSAVAATVVMHRAIETTSLRILVGAALPILVAMLAGAVPVALVVEASRASCVVNEASTGGCHVYGAPVHDVVQSAASAPMFAAAGAAVAAAYVAVYAAAFAWRRSAQP